MNLEKLIENEAKKRFDDVNAIRREARESGTHSFFDEWVVTGLLGRGSFGNVYKIVKPQLGVTAQECALKICQINTPADAELMTTEIETQKLLSGHPNAVQIEDYAIINREPPAVSYMLIRMELLNKLPENGLSERETIKLGIDICSVLEKCFSREPKLVHCDIKPANILVTNDGRYKLGDFGTAKTLQATMTYTGNRGTPLYMAPEVSAYGTGYDYRCDIYSLGYTMLTMLNKGKHPYEDDITKLADMNAKGKLPQVKGVSSGLMKIIRRMCAPNPQQRYSRASEIKRELELYVRKKEEAERIAKLEAEKQAELAKKKTKAERVKNVKIADNAAAKAEYELKLVQNELERSTDENKAKCEQKVERFAAKLERAVKVQRYVAEGETYENACRRVKEEELAALRAQKEKSKKKGFAVLAAMAAIIIIVCVGAWIVLLRENAAISSDSKNANTLSTADINILSNTDFLIKNKVAVDYYYEDEPTNIRRTINLELFSFVKVDAGYVIDKYIGDEADIVIPIEYKGELVVGIKSSVFEESSITSVIISDTVYDIEPFAFKNSKSLKEVHFFDFFRSDSDYKKISTISNSMFYGCSSLKTVKLPDSIEQINGYAFAECTSLAEINIPNKLNRIRQKAFFNCPASSRIKDYAFFDEINCDEDAFT